MKVDDTTAHCLRAALFSLTKARHRRGKAWKIRWRLSQVIPVNRTKARIIQAAIDLFARQGYGSTSIREIAKQADVNSALISYHFKNKQGVLEMIIVEYFETMFQQFEIRDSSGENAPRDYFEEFMSKARVLMEYQREHYKVTSMIQRELSVDSMLAREVMSTYLAKLKALFVSIVEKGIEAGQFRGDLDQDMKLIQLLSGVFFPYFNPRIIQEVFYIDPLSEEYIDKYMEDLSNTWREKFNKEESS